MCVIIVFGIRVKLYGASNEFNKVLDFGIIMLEFILTLGLGFGFGFAFRCWGLVAKHWHRATGPQQHNNNNE